MKNWTQGNFLIVTFLTTSKAKTILHCCTTARSEDELVQLKDEQNYWSWVDVPTQVAPVLCPARALELVAQLARHASPFYVYCITDTIVSLEVSSYVYYHDEPFGNIGPLPLYHDVQHSCSSAGTGRTAGSLAPSPTASLRQLCPWRWWTFREHFLVITMFTTLTYLLEHFVRFLWNSLQDVWRVTQFRFTSHNTQLSFRFIPAILEIRVSCHPSNFLTEKGRRKNTIGWWDSVRYLNE